MSLAWLEVSWDFENGCFDAASFSVAAFSVDHHCRRTRELDREPFEDRLTGIRFDQPWAAGAGRGPQSLSTDIKEHEAS
jgi:hypothetical protein